MLSYIFSLFSAEIIRQAERVISWPVSSATSSDNSSSTTTDTGQVELEVEPSAKRQRTSIFASYQRNTSADNILQEPFSSISALVVGYIDAIHTNVLRSWPDMKQSGFIRLAPLIEKLLCITSTSAPVERVFSHGGLFVRPHRARLGDKTLCDMVMLKCNKHLCSAAR